MSAIQRKSLGLEIIAPRTHWPSSNSETNAISVPANEDRCSGETCVCVISWVVRSNTHSPRREIERKLNMTMAAKGRGATGIDNPMKRVSALSGKMEWLGSLRYHMARTTGTCGNQLRARIHRRKFTKFPSCKVMPQRPLLAKPMSCGLLSCRS